MPSRLFLSIIRKIQFSKEISTGKNAAVNHLQVAEAEVATPRAVDQPDNGYLIVELLLSAALMGE
jgi:hypothetical protein